MRLSMRFCFSVTVMGLALGIAPWARVAAGVPAEAQAQTPLPLGSAAGTFTASGKTVKLTHATTFRNDKHVVLLLTDQEVPSASWKDAGDQMMYRMAGHKWGGVEFYLDENRKVTTANYYAGDFPTGANPAFELKLDRGTGKSLTGSAHSTPFGEKQLDSHLKLDVRFNAPLR